MLFYVIFGVLNKYLHDEGYLLFSFLLLFFFFNANDNEHYYEYGLIVLNWIWLTSSFWNGMEGELQEVEKEQVRDLIR